MTQTLGQRLAATRQAKKEHSTELLRQRATIESAEALRKFSVVETFFQSVKVEFETQILANATKVEVLVGNTGNEADNEEVESLMTSSTYSGDLALRVERTTHPYYPLWKDFKAWTIEQGLIVKFEYRHDGVGLRSWYALTAQPVSDMRP